MRTAESFMPIEKQAEPAAGRRLTDDEAMWSLQIGFGFQGV